MSKPQTARETTAVLYATFPRRLKGLVVDFLVTVASLAVVTVVASLLQNFSGLRNVAVIVWLLRLILYEPLSVWLLGGTVGHRAMNLCVVNNRTGKSISPAKAFARFLIKGVLGLLSFLTMSFTSAIRQFTICSPIRAFVFGIPGVRYLINLSWAAHNTRVHPSRP